LWIAYSPFYEWSYPPHQVLAYQPGDMSSLEMLVSFWMSLTPNSCPRLAKYFGTNHTALPQGMRLYPFVLWHRGVSTLLIPSNKLWMARHETDDFTSVPSNLHHMVLLCIKVKPKASLTHYSEDCETRRLSEKSLQYCSVSTRVFHHMLSINPLSVLQRIQGLPRNILSI
jgi:hypothetical protein